MLRSSSLRSSCLGGRHLSPRRFAPCVFFSLRFNSNTTLPDDLKLYNQFRRDDNNLWNQFRTKGKILASFLQVIGGFQDNLKFPNLFKEFARYASEAVNFDPLVIFGCLYSTNHHDKLLFLTIFPLACGLVVFIGGCVLYFQVKKEKTRHKIWNNTIALLLTIQYCFFIVTSTVIFQTLGCSQHGDDPATYLDVDRSIKCIHGDGTMDRSHRLYEAYALVMVFVYPLGTLFMYIGLLVTRRSEIKEENRDVNLQLSKLAFLFDDYERQCWWFEVFEAVRKLSLTAVLAFVSSESTE